MEPILVTSIKTNPKDSHGQRLHTQNEFVKDILQYYPPTLVFFEKGFSRHAISTQTTYRCVGVFNLLLKDYEITYLAPTTVKKAIAGSGRSKKDEVQNAILKKYPDIEFSNEDESDAMAVVLTGLIKDNLIEWEV